MSTTKFPNSPKPIVGACSDGFPKPVAAWVSEYSEVICFHEPLLACQSNPTVKPQVLRQVNQTALNPEPKFQTTVKPELSKPFVDVYDPLNEDVHQMEEPVNSHKCFKGSGPVKVPSLLKVGEDPYDPWNIYECDVDSCGPLPCFGVTPKPNPMELLPTWNHKPNLSFSKQGMISMTHGTFVNNCLVFTTSTNQQSSLPVPILWTLETHCSRSCFLVTCSVLATLWIFEFVDTMKRTIRKSREWVRRDSPTKRLHFMID